MISCFILLAHYNKRKRKTTMSKLIKPDPFGFHVAQGVVTAGRVALLCKNALTPGEEGEILSPDLPQ